MKKFAIFAVTFIFSLATLSGCGSSSNKSAPESKSAASVSSGADAATSLGTDDKVITVGASSTPHAEILEQTKDALAKEGYTLNIVVYDDYVLPNKALADGELDANYFQHLPYLNSYNKSNNTDLVSAGAIHYEPFGIYGNGVTKLADLKKGATIIIPADDSNQTRALFLLKQEGLIKLPADASAANGVTTLDIVDNGGYNIKSVQADTVAAQLKNSDKGTIAVINGNYAIEAGFKVADALAIEDASGDSAQTYANIIAVRNGDQNSTKIKALLAALKTDAVKKYIEDTYKGAVVALY